MPKGGKKATPPAPGTEKVLYPVTLRRIQNRRSSRLSNLFSMFD